MSETQTAAPNEIHGYAVSEACIACDACCNDFPEVFKMNGDHTRAIPFAEIKGGVYDPWDVIYDCPVDAISLIKGTLPPPPADKKPASQKDTTPVIELGEITDNRPWEIRWAEAQKRGAETYWERMKRYGMASSMEETLDKYFVRVALPDRVPDHALKYKWNLPEKMPDYKFDIQLQDKGKKLFFKGWLEDAAVKRLCGIANSFPDRFLREIELGEPAKDVSFNYNPKDKVLDIVIEKAVVQ